MARFSFPVEAGHILLFARAIGDESIADVEAGREVAAPPTFVQCSAQFDPDYHLRPKPGAAWFGSASGPGGVAGEAPRSGALHAEQHFEYLRPIQAGETLTVETREGERWEKASRRGGTLRFAERITEYRDESGVLVCRARMVVINTQDAG